MDSICLDQLCNKSLFSVVNRLYFKDKTSNVMDISGDGLDIKATIKTVTAIPYYVWCNRGSNQMQVWLPQKINDIKLNY